MTVTTRRIEKAKILMDQGMNKVEIAKQLDITPPAISKWLKSKPELNKLFVKV